MAKPTVYIKGDWNAICDECGRRFRASHLRKRWDGLMVCQQDFEQRHPQDFVRAKVDIQTVPWTRPEPSATYIAVSSISAIAGIAIAGIAVAGSSMFSDTIPSGTFTL